MARPASGTAMREGIVARLLTLPLRVAAALYAMLRTLLPLLPRLTAANGPADHHNDAFAAAFAEAVGGDTALQPPPQFNGGYPALVRAVQRDLRPALVVLHARDHESAPRFCRDVLAADVFHAVVREHRLHVWCGVVDAPEPYAVACALGVAAFPALALITLAPNPSGVAAPTIVFRAEGAAATAVAPDTLCARLDDAVRTHGLLLATVRAERERRESERAMLRMQDEAYQESLRRDRERQRQLEQERENERRAAEAAAAKRQRRAERLESRRQHRTMALSSLPREPAPLGPPSADGPEIPVQVRLPWGDRLRRSFTAAASVRDVYDYVDTADPRREGAVQNPDEWVDPDASSGDEDEFVRPHGFLLVEVYPRRELRDLGAQLVDLPGAARGLNLVVEV